MHIADKLLQGENFGEADGEKGGSSVSLKSMVMDKRILSLGLATTLFEGCMFLFVFFWTPALKSSRAVAGTTASPPFGLIFSCFMSAMMLGSMLFSVIDLRSERETGRLLLSILAMAAISLMVPVLMRTEGLTFWSFAIFEACVGMYFPTMGRLKSEIVDDAVRGKVYALMRLPLNIFVVLALGLTQEGESFLLPANTVLTSLTEMPQAMDIGIGSLRRVEGCCLVPSSLSKNGFFERDWSPDPWYSVLNADGRLVLVRSTSGPSPSSQQAFLANIDGSVQSRKTALYPMSNCCRI